MATEACSNHPVLHSNHHDGGFGKFYKLYQINVGNDNNKAESGRVKQGLKSTFGTRGAICELFGWTYEYLCEQISWALVQRMLADRIKYDTETDKENKPITLTDENAGDVLAMMQKISKSIK